MQPDTYGFLNLRVMDGVAIGPAPVRVGSGERRSAIKIAALDVPVWLKFGGGAEPSMSEADFHDQVAAGESTSWMGLSESIVIWAWSPEVGALNVVEASY